MLWGRLIICGRLAIGQLSRRCGQRRYPTAAQVANLPHSVPHHCDSVPDTLTFWLDMREIVVVALILSSAGCSVKRIAINKLGNALSSGGSQL